MEGETIRLFGAADAGDAEQTMTKQYMQLDLDQDILEEFVSCCRRGKPPQLILGRNSSIRYGDKSHVLETREATFKQELYRNAKADDESERENEWDFVGTLGHIMTLRRAERASNDLEIALETLKHNIGSIKEEQEAKKTLITTELPSSRGKKSHPSQRLPARRAPGIPDTKASSGKQSILSPNNMTNTFVNMNREVEAAKYSLIHLLAIKPLTLERCVATLRAKRAVVENALQRIAERKEESKYHLRKMFYKELDVWKFGYPAKEDRQSAIENAVRAFDSQRIDPSDKIWQKLLPVEQRGKGKILSKLKLNPGGNTPLVRPNTVAVAKNGQPKKTEPKKTEKPAKNGGDKLIEKPAKEKTDKATEKKTATVSKTSTSSSSNKDKPREKNVGHNDSDAARTPSLKSKTNTPKERTAPFSTKEKDRPSSRDEKPSTAVKALLNKPKNPSPLISSPPINASDFEPSHPVHKALAGKLSPHKKRDTEGQKSLKRKSDQHDEMKRGEKAVKKAKVDDGSNGTPKGHGVAKTSIALRKAGSAGVKRKAEEESSSSEDTPLAVKLRKLKHGDSHSQRSVPDSHSNISGHRDQKPTPNSKVSHNSTTSTKKHIMITSSSAAYKSSPALAANGVSARRKSDSSSGSETSPSLALGYRETIELAARFKKVYAKYEKLYHEISSESKSPGEERLKELLSMHTRLEDMKRKLGSV